MILLVTALTKETYFITISPHGFKIPMRPPLRPCNTYLYHTKTWRFSDFFAGTDPNLGHQKKEAGVNNSKDEPQDIQGNVFTVLGIYSLNVGATRKPLLSLKLMSSCLQ